jgi:small neutral amino acid transporter SnatA (MarC family)
MKFFWEVFVTLAVIIDPAGIVPVFLGLTRGRSRQDRNQLAGQATIVAFGVIVVFALFGRTILDYLGVGLAALEGAGGLLPLLAGPGAIVAAIAIQLAANSAIAFARGALADCPRPANRNHRHR